MNNKTLLFGVLVVGVCGLATKQSPPVLLFGFEPFSGAKKHISPRFPERRIFLIGLSTLGTTLSPRYKTLVLFVCYYPTLKLLLLFGSAIDHSCFCLTVDHSSTTVAVSLKNRTLVQQLHRTFWDCRVTIKVTMIQMNTVLRSLARLPFKSPIAIMPRSFHVGYPIASHTLRKVELTPLEQRKLTFDSHAVVTDLEKSGFEKNQAEIIVSTLVTLSTANMDIVYKDMVTSSHQVSCHTYIHIHTITTHTAHT